MRLPVKRLDSGLPLPAYAHEGDAGMDLYAAAPASFSPAAGSR
jgi:dUTP pyrophosphatase